MAKKTHKIFDEIARIGDDVYYYFAIPGTTETYIAKGTMLTAVKKGIFFNKKIEDFQGLTVLPYPAVLDNVIGHFATNESNYDENTDLYDEMFLPHIIESWADSSIELLHKQLDTLDKQENISQEAKLAIANNALNLIEVSKFIKTPEWRHKACFISLELSDNGHTLLWADSTPRVRTLLFVRQADSNTLVYTQVREFIPRDGRKNNTFLGMSSMTIAGEATPKILDYMFKGGK